MSEEFTIEEVEYDTGYGEQVGDLVVEYEVTEVSRMIDGRLSIDEVKIIGTTLWYMHSHSETECEVSDAYSDAEWVHQAAIEHAQENYLVHED